MRKKMTVTIKGGDKKRKVAEVMGKMKTWKTQQEMKEGDEEYRKRRRIRRRTRASRRPELRRVDGRKRRMTRKRRK